VTIVHKNQWTQTGVSAAVAAAGCLLFIAAAEGGVRGAAVPFDLAVQEVLVKQVSSTPMFRTVEITCVVENRGPGVSNATAWILISRPGDARPMVVKLVSIPKLMELGAKFQVQSQAFSWVPTSVPYRCEIQFVGPYTAGDADPSNDFAETTFPTL
jgi:hypothetical protein